MTSNTLLTKIKTKLILALIIVGLLCSSMLVLSACSNDDSSKIPSYSYSDTDDGLISNPNFDYNTSGIKLENFPETSPTGWTRSKDESGSSSSAKSGVVDLSEEGWKAYLNSVYSDQYTLKYLEEKLSFSKSDIESELKNNDSSIKAEALKAEVVKYYSEKFTAPKLKDGANDNKVFMLNNYTSNIQIGASQKITSASTIQLEKGKFVAISVDVLTQNITTTDSDGNSVTLGLAGANNDFGASIRLTSSLSGNSQAEYAITNINTNGSWERYTVYAQGDDEFDCTVTLALGLGYSDQYPTEGTVYFDNITVEELDTVSNLPSDKKTLQYGETKAQIVNAGSDKAFFYDMNLEISDEYYKPTTISIEEFAKTAKFESSSAKLEGNTVTLKDASYSVKISDAEKFKISNEGYTYVSLKLDSKLNKLGSTSITFDVYENTEGYKEKPLPAVATVTESGETTVGLMIKNNFEESYAKDRTFYIVITVGPTNGSTTEKLGEFATGTVKISDLKVASGKTYQYKRNAEGVATEELTDNYKFYQLFNGLATGTTSLFAGYESDFTATVEGSTASTGFNIAATDNEYLNKQPVAPSEYDGIVYDHKYLNADSKNSNVNDRTNGNDKTANVAGVIDTQFLAEYSNANLSELKNMFDADEKIRPLMIYNKAEDAYGFINNQGAQVISANSFATVSVKVKVVGANANAYIYLVDTTTKEVLTFETFTPNTNGITSILAKEKVGEELKMVVGDTDGEWVEIKFYIATGKTEKSFRVELWNGSRTGEDKSTGYVFFSSVNVTLTNAFNEPESFKDSFTNSDSPLYGKDSTFTANNPYLCYSRPLTETEKKYNTEYPDSAVSYSPKIVWAKNSDTLYAIFNNIDVSEVNPYDNIEEDTEEKGSGCAAETDPSTFWLSFSSIVLVVVLIIAIIALFVKKFRRKKKSSDAKSHYTVQSRVRSVPKAKKETATKEIKEVETEENQPKTEEVETEEATAEESLDQTAETESVENTEESEENKEQTLDDYVYGDVQNFGEESEENKE